MNKNEIDSFFRAIQKPLKNIIVSVNGKELYSIDKFGDEIEIINDIDKQLIYIKIKNIKRKE
jgi:hypothetical protein